MSEHLPEIEITAEMTQASGRGAFTSFASTGTCPTREVGEVVATGLIAGEVPESPAWKFRIPSTGLPDNGEDGRVG
jgi:hypothetical protein